MQSHVRGHPDIGALAAALELLARTVAAAEDILRPRPPASFFFGDLFLNFFCLCFFFGICLFSFNPQTFILDPLGGGICLFS